MEITKELVNSQCAAAKLQAPDMSRDEMLEWLRWEDLGQTEELMWVTICDLKCIIAKDALFFAEELFDFVKTEYENGGHANLHRSTITRCYDQIKKVQKDPDGHDRIRGINRSFRIAVGRLRQHDIKILNVWDLQNSLNHAKGYTGILTE